MFAGIGVVVVTSVEAAVDVVLVGRGPEHNVETASMANAPLGSLNIA